VAGRPVAAAGEIDQLWVGPGDLESRDVFYGPGGRELVPATDVAYRFKSLDTTGHSGGYEVVDPQDRKWKVKIGDEVGSEIAVSRILWAIGYHQPALYFVPRWRMTGGPKSSPEPGRFRFESDHKKEGDWSFEDNPFVHSQPLHGLLVVNLLLNNWDLKDDNNKIIYVPASGNSVPELRYIISDLGATFGKTGGVFSRNRNSVESFAGSKFVEGVQGGNVRFAYGGKNTGLFKNITLEQTKWIGSWLSRLTVS